LGPINEVVVLEVVVETMMDLFSGYCWVKTFPLDVTRATSMVPDA
jgi:hypothetical protein